MKLWRLLLSLALAALPGCRPTPFATPAHGGSEWVEVTSAHFELKTELGRSAAVELSDELETTLEALARLAFETDRIPSSRIRVVHFRQVEEYRAVAPKLSSGVFDWRGRHDFERVPIAMFAGEFDESTRETFVHELTHVLVHYHLPQAPTWLNEGMADYYSTLEIAGGKATLGWPSAYHWVSWGSWEPLLDVVHMTPDEFYGDEDQDPETRYGQEIATKRRLHYHEATTIIRVLLNKPDRRKLFFQYLNELSIGRSAPDAWAATLGRVPPRELQAEYRAMILRNDTPFFRTSYEPAHSPAPAVRGLSDDEVRLLWASLRQWRSETDVKATLADLDATYGLSVDPEEVALFRASWFYENGDSRRAERILREATQSNPKRRRLLNALGWIRLDRLVDRSALGNGEIAHAMEDVARELEPIAVSAAEHDLLARYYAFSGDYDRSLACEKRAMAADPSCFECLQATAEFLARKGLPAEAVTVAELALALLPEGTGSGQIVRQIERYRKQQASSKAVPSVARVPL
jgi:tetratricopeptide (TPR) repeat protein